MIRNFAITTLLASALALTACSNEPSVDEQKLEKIHEEAPSWTKVHTDEELVTIMDQVCVGDTPPTDSKITLFDYNYLVGLSMATCDK